MNETMTAEQAASKLTNIMHDDHYAWSPSILEAFRMAVDALKGAYIVCGACEHSDSSTLYLTNPPKVQCRKTGNLHFVTDSCECIESPSAQSNANEPSQRVESVESVGDTISRQAAIDEVARWTGYLDEDMITRIQIGLKRLPSAQPEQRWIPCGKCIHADGKHRWCKVLDRTINEDYFCCWAEPWKEGEADG